MKSGPVPVRPSPTAVFEPPVTERRSGWDFEGISKSDDLTPCCTAAQKKPAGGRLARYDVWQSDSEESSSTVCSSDEELPDVPPVLERLVANALLLERSTNNNTATLVPHRRRNEEGEFAAQSHLLRTYILARAVRARWEDQIKRSLHVYIGCQTFHTYLTTPMAGGMTSGWPVSLANKVEGFEGILCFSRH